MSPKKTVNEERPAHATFWVRLLAFLLIIFVFHGLLLLRAEAQDRSVSLAFVAPRRLAILGQNPGERAVISRPGDQTRGPQDLVVDFPPAVQPSNTSMKKDRRGRLYLFWEEAGPRRGAVGFGPVAESGLVRPEPLRLPDGWNRLPDLCFDLGNGSWLTWVNAQLGRQTLFVRQSATGRAWSLATAGAMLRPRILCDAAGRLWLFWGETSRASFRLLYRVFDGGQWSAVQTACDAGPLAIGSYAAAVDEAGSPWVTWSQFTDRSYSVYVRQKKGTAWSFPVRLSTNPQAQNISPSIALAAGLGPVVSWVRSSGTETALCLRVSSPAGWSRETVVPGVEALQAIPQIEVENGSLAVAWMSGGRPKGRILFLARLAVPDSSQPVPISDFGSSQHVRSLPGPAMINNPELDEDSYIGYGDSITLGVINGEYHPELGYVPRLETLLTDNYGPSQVINEGVGSQITANGLARLDEVLSADLSRYLLILEGTNDTVTLIYNPDITGFNLEEMARRSRNFGSFPAMGTLLPRFDSAARPERIIEVNDRIRELTQLLAVPLVDFYTLFNDYPAGDGGVLSLMSDDLLHPNEKGYQFMAEKWLETIRDFPFPPVEVQIRREYDKIFFYQVPGNMLTWKDSPKIVDRTEIQGYRLYRKLSAAGDDTYVLITTIPGGLEYFDADIAPGMEYTYVISTITTQGVEGPCSVPVKL